MIQNLLKEKKISNEEYNQASNEKLTFVGEKEKEELSTVMYYQDAVMKELNSLKEIPSTFLETGGLKIYTSLNLKSQKELEANVKETLGDNELETAAVLLDPQTGGVKALIGGKDYTKSEYNRAISAKRQVGSTMKPFLYYAALENGFTASTTFTSEQTTFTFSNKDTYSPKNYNEKYGNKPISMATAISYSENIYAV